MNGLALIHFFKPTSNFFIATFLGQHDQFENLPFEINRLSFGFLEDRLQLANCEFEEPDTFPEPSDDRLVYSVRNVKVVHNHASRGLPKTLYPPDPLLDSH